MSAPGAFARVSGPRRRRADGAHPDDHRRHCFATRARTLPGDIGAVFATSSVGGPVLGRLSDGANRLVADLLDHVPLGLCALGMTSNVLRRVPYHPAQHKLDVIGSVLMMAASVALLFALTWGGVASSGFSPQDRRAAVRFSRALGSVFLRLVRKASRSSHCLFSPSGRPLVATLAGACNKGTLVGMTIFVPLYFEDDLHLSASESGMALIPLMGATVIFFQRSPAA